MTASLEFKKEVIQKIIDVKTEQFNNLKSAQRGQLEDTKVEDIDQSDPFESTRSQLQEEVGQQSEPIDFLAHELETLKTIRTEESHTAATFGSLLETNHGFFLIGVAQNQFTLEGRKITGISVDSPLFKEMNNKIAEAKFHFGNTEYIIQSVA